MDSPNNFRSFTAAAFFLLPVLIGTELEGQQPSLERLGNLVTWEDTIRLEENADVINVVTRVTADPEGGYLVADERRGQFRRYADDGRLVWYFGRTGEGPGEFHSPRRAIRLDSTTVVLADREMKILVYDELTGEHRTIMTELLRINDLNMTSDGRLLLSTGISNPEAPRLLHVLDSTSGDIVLNFFRPHLDDENLRPAVFVNWSSAAVSGDTVAAVMAVSDTVYLFRDDGSAMKKLPLRSEHFRPMESPEPEVWRSGGRLREWVERYSFVRDVYWLGDGTLLVQYQRFRDNVPSFGLLRMDLDGRPLFEANDTPRLVVVDPVTRRLVVEDPQVMEGNVWIIGRLR